MYSIMYLQITSTVLSFPMDLFTPHQTPPTDGCRGTQVGFNPAWHSNLRAGPGRGVFWEGPFFNTEWAANVLGRVKFLTPPKKKNTPEN